MNQGSSRRGRLTKLDTSGNEGFRRPDEAFGEHGRGPDMNWAKANDGLLSGL